MIRRVWGSAVLEESESMDRQGRLGGGGLVQFSHTSPFDLLAARASEQPEADALVWRPLDGPRRVWSYAELRTDVERVAAGLRRCGVTRGAFVGVHASNSPEFVLAWLALNSLGAATVA